MPFDAYLSLFNYKPILELSLGTLKHNRDQEKSWNFYRKFCLQYSWSSINQSLSRLLKRCNCENTCLLIIIRCKCSVWALLFKTRTCWIPDDHFHFITLQSIKLKKYPLAIVVISVAKWLGMIHKTCTAKFLLLTHFCEIQEQLYLAQYLLWDIVCCEIICSVMVRQ